MLYIFDFDYTLFDTAVFKQDYFKQFVDLAYDPNNLRLEHFKENVIHYNIKEHLDLLGDNLKDHNKSVETLNVFLSDLKRYLFPGAEEVLMKLKNEGHKLILISLGNLEFQKSKILGSGIEKFFEQIIITPGSKALLLEKINIGEEQVIIVNDNAQESLEMMKLIDNAKLFLIESRYSQNDEGIETHDLQELLSFK